MRFFSWLTATEERRICLALTALCAMIYIPLAGNYGMWDPWETHYGEVARQMLQRNDFISQWWPGSPQDRAEFWSKPVLSFWLIAIGMKLAGLQWAGAPPSEMASSWRVEWASRMPFVVLGIVGVWATWELVRRLAGPRAGVLAAIILATSSQWLLISRQAMTDMAFVAPMTLALALAGLGLLLPEEERERELPRRHLGASPPPGQLGWLSWPHAPAFYGFVALFALTTLPQLVMISVQLQVAMRIRSMTVHLAGVVPMLPYIACFVVGVWWCARARCRRQLYLFSAYVLCALATLAKGPAGVGLPVLVLFVYLILAGRWRDLIFKSEILRGIVLFVATAFPWYHAMLIRHGMGFWNEFIGDNYVHRSLGRHGDRGTFEYYIQYLGYGMFPWSGLAAVGALLSFKKLRGKDGKAGLIGFALTWLLVEFTVMSLVNTKFHHYILPALPALAILAGVFLDELLSAPTEQHVLSLSLLAVPLTFLCGRDLAAFPARLLWLFNYDYVNAPGSGRPWPAQTIYGERYEYGNQLFVITVVATLAVAALTAVVALTRARASAPAGGEPNPDPNSGPYRQPSPPVEKATAEPGLPIEMLVGMGLFIGGAVLTFVLPTGRIFTGALGVGAGLMIRSLMRRKGPGGARVAWHVVGGAAIFFIALAISIHCGPDSPEGAAPKIGPWDWLAPTFLMLPFVALLAFVATERRARTLALWAMTLVAVVWSGFLVDKILIEVSPHWSQKHVLASYYAKRSSPDEPLIAWQLYWRGENFYTKNQIYSSATPTERTVFLGDHNAEKMQQYFTSHAGRRVFFVVERTRLETLRGLLPAAARSSLQIVDETNNKIYLAVAKI